MYRSDIRLSMYKKGYDKLLSFYKGKGFVDCLIQREHIKENENGKVMIELYYLPLSKNDTDLKNLIVGLNHLKNNDLSFHYIRIGEDDNDTEDIAFTAKGDFPLPLRYPEFVMEEGEES